MIKKIRSAMFVWAVMGLMISNLAGCAASGTQAGKIADTPLQPTKEALVGLTEGTLVKVVVESGQSITGTFDGLSRGATSIDVRVNDAVADLAPEFVEEDHLYRIPLESITALSQVAAEEESKPSGLLIGLGIVLIGFFTAAALGAFNIE